MLQTAEEEEGDEAFYRRPKAVSKSWALVMRGTLANLTSAGEYTQGSTNRPGVPGKH